MHEIYLLVLTFLIMSLIVNVVPRFPNLPGDIYLDKIGIPIKIPVFSSLVISVLLILFKNFL